MNFLDSSILIAAARRTHPKHSRCASLLRNATPDTTGTAAHAFAESYSHLSGGFDPRPLSPRVLWPILQNYAQRLALVHLDAAELLQVVSRCAESGITGGAIYDALLIACARKLQAKRIYTLNTRDFFRIAPDFADIIKEP